MTAILLVLFACNAFYGSFSEAREPPKCPALSVHKKCPAGLANQCTKDSDCPTFTRCCWDGCNKRCVDTTSKIAIHSRAKYGVCPRHEMQNPCAATFDLCLDDSYCLGDEKCCMDTDCGKKCMLPKTLERIKNATRAFKCPNVKSHEGKCPKNPKHSCALDSECPTYTACCYDGCRRRCTDQNGEIVPNRKGSSCPLFPPPARCPVSFKECNNDEDCSFSMKCCSDTCNYWCMPSLPHRVTIPDPVDPATTKSKRRGLYKPGKCPIMPKLASCENQVYQCNYDVDCWDSEKKCCDNGCVTTCVDPVFTKHSITTPAFRTTGPQLKTALKTDLLTTTSRPIIKTKAKTRPSTTERKTPEVTMKHTPFVARTTEKTTVKTFPTRPTIITTPTTTRVERRYTEPRVTQRIVTEMKTPPPLKDGVTIYPKSDDAVAGSTIKTVCYVRGEPFEGWYDPKGLKITNAKSTSDTYVYGHGNDYTLVVKKVGEEHGGKYTCRSAFANDTYSLTIRLSVSESQTKAFLRARTTGMVKVPIQGYPRPKFEWMREYKPLDVTNSRYTVTPGGTLIIKDVKMSDKGKYTVSATNLYMKDNGKFTSAVAHRVDADVAIEVIGGKCPMPKKISCLAQGRDECIVDRDCPRTSSCCFDGCRHTCTKINDKEKGPVNPGYCPVLLPPAKCLSTSKECLHDGYCYGIQKCCSDSCTLRCIDPKRVSPEYIPGVQTYPSIKTMCNPNKPIRLVCRIDKQPFEGWFDSYGRKILSETHGTKMQVEDHGIYQVLLINNVTARDGGTYTCQGAFDSAEVNLNVNRTIDRYDHPIILHPGKSGLILQNVQCYPIPKFVWYKRGRPIDPSSSDRYSVSPSGSLSIRRVRSIDMGVYSLKIHQGGKVLDTGVRVAAAVEGVDFTEWQDSFTPGASVRCLKDTMYIDLKKNVLNDYSELDLTLANSSCRATSNRTHFSLKAPLMGCGTEAKFTEEAVVYSNLVKEYRRKSMITRIQDIRIPFSCFYTKEGVTSTFGLLPTKVRKILDGGNATTTFELGMSLFRDESFSLSYGVKDFPLKVTVNRPLYVQVSIDSPDKRLSVMADRCYATPTQNPDHVMQYDIVNDGCAVDPTVEFYKGNYNVQRFSFKAFQFIAEGRQFVYIHCHLIVCNASNPTSRCSQGCLSSFGRLRRGVDSAAEADLTQGPIIMENRPKALAQTSSGSFFEKYVWIMVGMGGFCIICLIIMMYLKRQISLHRQMPLPDPDRETDV